ncbi:hypothetical protein [Pseudaminobacter salicylatoxidans]|uniref:hypothetical protein n=1 Tax=Pseudaminobacter salicylatoxidans TaxID=93369 RepID=UPI0002E5651A|nr:hypothetical protein [Pseudaminobacter salicylatoxidans]
MQLSQIEQTLHELIENERAAEAKRRWRPLALLRRWGTEAGKPDRRGDLVIAGLGVTLGLVCALFPWYIFFNQEKFGIEALKFGEYGESDRAGPLALNARTLRPVDLLPEDALPSDALDPFATGTLPDAKRERTPVANQPFPLEDVPYQLLHVVNGRGLIEDEAGLWVVQPGALLPDSSRVASIERRAGKWVMVTNREKVVEINK